MRSGMAVQMKQIRGKKLKQTKFLDFYFLSLSFIYVFCLPVRRLHHFPLVAHRLEYTQD